MSNEPMTPEQIDAAIEGIKAEARALAPEMAADVDWNAILDDVATVLCPMIEHAASKAKSVDATPLFMSGLEMRRRNAPPPDFIIQNLIPSKGVGALSGEPKAAKSWDATYISVCVAAGVSVFDRYAVQAPAAVAYSYAEDTEEAVNCRREAIAMGLGLDPGGSWLGRWFAQPRGRKIDVLNTAELCVLAASIRRIEQITGEKFALLIVDPLSNIHSGEEDKRDSMVHVMARLHALEAYLRLAVLFVHHSGKASADNKVRTRGGQKMRGSSAIHGAVDFGIYLSNLRGDGKNEFTARIESEMKAARGAGMFDRTLKIDDNDRGNAVRARFEASDCVEATKQRESSRQLVEDRAVDVVAKLFEHGSALTFDQLHTKIRGGRAELREAVEIAKNHEWIAQRIHKGHKAGYEITDSGRDLYRDGKPADGTAPAAAT
jgi:hypothetical protein